MTRMRAPQRVRLTGEALFLPLPRRRFTMRRMLSPLRPGLGSRRHHGGTTRYRLAAVAALAGLLAGGQAVAGEPLAHDLRIDVPVAAAAGLGWIGSELAKSSL